MKDTEAEELDLALTPAELVTTTPAPPQVMRRRLDYYDGDDVEPLDDLPNY